MILLHSFLIFVTSIVSFVSGTNEQVVKFDDTSGQIRFGAPNPSVEEESSLHMPVALRCDGCQIISHLMYEFLAKEEKKLPAKSKSLSESSIFDAIDKVCTFDYKEYGITEVNGKKRLKGPGLDSESAVGVTQAGGRWPWRLQAMCNDYVGEFDEEEIYQEFKSAYQAKNYESFSRFLCKNNDHKDLAYCLDKDKSKNEL